MTSPASLASAALRKASDLLAALTEEQLLDLVDGEGRLVFQSGETVIAAGRRPVARSKPALDIPAEVATIEAMESAEAVHQHLVRRKFTIAVLKQIAVAVGPRVSTSGRTKADLLRNIAEGTVGHRRRAEALAGDAWA